MRFSTSIVQPVIQSPHRVGRLMFGVFLAAMPGLLLQAWQFGWGVLIHLLIALIAALMSESIILRMRGKPTMPYWLDGSAALTALLLAISLPPLLPFGLTLLGVLFAIVIAKHLYGGLGHNPFNPAMVGYAVLLVSFPRHMTAWLPPHDLSFVNLSLDETWRAIFNREAFDSLTQATPLDWFKIQSGLHRDIDEIQSSPLFAALGGKGWHWVNFGFLLGGLWMVYRGLIDWRIPAGFLTGLGLMSLLFFLIDPGVYPPPLFHLFSGSCMLGAFFIATDPVTAAASPKGRLFYGAGIGLLLFMFRSWGSYPDGLAFAVLLLNWVAPTLDYFTRPRVYGFLK